MPKNSYLYDVVGMALTDQIDKSLKRNGEYRDNPTNAITSFGASTFLGIVGTAINPVAGILTAAIGHCIGQAVDWDSKMESRDTSKEQSKIPPAFYDYGEF